MLISFLCNKLTDVRPIEYNYNYLCSIELSKPSIIGGINYTKLLPLKHKQNTCG